MLSNFHEQMQSLREAHNVNEYMRGDNRNNGVTQQTLRTLIGALLNNLHEGNVDEAIYQAEEIEHNIENLHINTSSCDSISEHLQDAWRVMYGDHYGTIDN